MRSQFFLFLFPLAVFGQLVDGPMWFCLWRTIWEWEIVLRINSSLENSDEQQIHTPAMQKLANMGMLFTDAHTPSSRCTPTRYGLLTGRYPWRARMKHWVLFGVQGDPLIEEDRPTLATLFRSCGYATAIVGNGILARDTPDRMEHQPPDGKMRPD